MHESPATAAPPAKRSALSEYFHIGLAGNPTSKPPLAPSPGKAQPSALGTRASANTSTASTSQVPHSTHDAPHAPGSADAAKQSPGQGSRPATASVGIKPGSAGVAAALNAVLHKKEGGVRGLSAAPDESLARDKVNKDVLVKMRETFARADKDGTGELSPEEFCASFEGILHTEDGSDTEALTKLFMRIDANSDGSVNWDEFCTYMLLESQGSANLRDLENSISFDDPVDWSPPEGQEHDKLITHITLATLPNGSERYVTCGRDGLVKVWNAKDLKLMRTITVGKSWVTAAKVLPATRKLAVTSFSRSMKIYDLQTFELCGQIPEIEYAPMAMDVWAPSRHKGVEMVAFGDGGGYVRLYELRLNPLEHKTSNDRYLDNVRWSHQHHTDWVTCIKYIEDLNAVVAGSLDKTVTISDADNRIGVKTLQGHLKGVSCLDWSPMYKFLVSGSQDRRVILWNPFSLKPLATLMGHLSSVTAVCVNDRDNQIISLGADKQVKLWDIRNHKCIQTLTDRQEVPGPEEQTLLCAAYDYKRKALITGALWPKMWRQTITASASCGHKEPVVKVLFNPLFNEAVSADASGIISIWYVPTGKLRFRFSDTHPKQTLTALAFDGQKRRLLTGADNGEVKVWNFSSGACLCVLRPKTHEEVTSVLVIRGALFKHFVVGGWDRNLTCFEDPGPGAKESYPGRVLQGHKADILDMAATANNQVVSVSDDGEVCSWNMESGTLRRRTTPPGHPELPMNEQAIEKILFLSGKLQHVFVTVGADRWLRFWDSSSLEVLCEVFTGHIMGETISGLALHPDNQALATGDASGIAMVWDMKDFEGRNLDTVAAKETIVQAAVWRAHKAGITSMEWVSVKEGDFILTSSADRTVSLWTTKGAFVGQFGACIWLLDTPGSWRSTEPYELDAKDVFDLNTAKVVPKRAGLLTAMSSRVSMAGFGRPESPIGSVLSPPATTGTRGASLLAGDTALSPRPVDSSPRRSMGLQSGRLRESCVSRASQSSGPVPRVSRLGFQDSDTSFPGWGSSSPKALPRISKVNIVVDTPLHDDGSDDVLEPEQSQDGARHRISMASRASSSRWGFGQSRPTTAPDDIARVLVASHHNRLRHIKSFRMHERPEEFEPGGRYSRPSIKGRQSEVFGALSPAEQAQASILRALEDADNPQHGSDSSSERLHSESSSSENHSSDEDIPRALFLDEFKLARRGAGQSAAGHLPSHSLYGAAQGRGKRRGKVLHSYHQKDLPTPDQPRMSLSALGGRLGAHR